MAVVATVSGMLAFGNTAAVANPMPAAPPGVVETLKANPGSVRTAEYTVLLKTGVMVTVPNGTVGIEAATQCQRGWACVWVDAHGPGVVPA
jgi:phage tail protein X